MRRYLQTLTAVVLVAAGLAAAGAAASGPAPVGVQSGTPVPGARSSATSEQQARAAAIRNCRRLENAARRKNCLRRVKQRFAAPVVPQQGPIAFQIDVRDKYFSPDNVDIRTGQSLLWIWGPLNADAHNVNLVGFPSGVSRLDFQTPSSPSVGFEFRRTFTVPGSYDFVCSIHYNMTMRVEVS
ncbi:MAG: plastocyanin/azurin family copper-binding protein [Solirubrobacterales bacterium]